VTVFGQSVFFTAVISSQFPAAGTPTGTVQFLIDGSSLGNPVSVGTDDDVTSASFTCSLSPGSHTVTAYYSGDSSFAGSSGSLPGGQTVNKADTNIAVTA